MADDWFWMLLVLCAPMFFLLTSGARQDPWTRARTRRALRMIGITELVPMTWMLHDALHLGGSDGSSHVMIVVAAVMGFASASCLIIAWRLKDPPGPQTPG